MGNRGDFAEVIPFEAEMSRVGVSLEEVLDLLAAEPPVGATGAFAALGLDLASATFALLAERAPVGTVLPVRLLSVPGESGSAKDGNNPGSARPAHCAKLDMSRALSVENQRALAQLLEAQAVEDPFSGDGAA
jgi:hypothetical protein